MRILTMLPVALAALMPVSTIAQSVQALPHNIVYKTTADYSDNVQVELGTDGRIRYYPSPGDVSAALKPVKLKKGYLLSKTGVSATTAYLNMTIEEYSALKQRPSANDLYSIIRDKSPMTELWDCGVRDELSVKQINGLIRKGKLATKCRRMK